MEDASRSPEWCADLCERLSSSDRDLEVCAVDGARQSVDASQLESLFDAMRKNTCISAFRLGHCNLSRSTILSLVPALKNCRSLESVLIEEVHDTEACLAEFLAVALFYNRSIQELVLRSCWSEGVSAFSIGSMLNTMFHLKELTICHNRIDAQTAGAIGLALQKNESLRLLNLTGNSLDCAAICALAPGLARNSHLQSLILDFNCFGDDGIDGLASMLKQNQSLEELHFFGNRVMGRGASRLSDALKVNASLKTLIISFNQIGDEGVAALAEALTINTTLEKVWFPSNAVGCEGMLAFADLLPKMKGLKQLNVGLLLDDNIEDALLHALKDNLHLSVLYIEKPVLFEEDEGCCTSVAAFMDFYLRCNRSGRRLLREPNFDKKLWSNVLSTAVSNSRSDGAPDVLHYMIRSNPALFDKFESN
jgi:hypothetical protein